MMKYNSFILNIDFEFFFLLLHLQYLKMSLLSHSFISPSTIQLLHGPVVLEGLVFGGNKVK